nr:interleukin-23 receptor [Taeniopygia guttata]
MQGWACPPSGITHHSCPRLTFNPVGLEVSRAGCDPLGAAASQAAEQPRDSPVPAPVPAPVPTRSGAGAAASIECKGRVWIEPAPVVRMGTDISIGCQSWLGCPEEQLLILLNYSPAEGTRLALPGGTALLRLRRFQTPFATVTCFSRCSRRDRLVCGTELRAGYPPDPPGNVSCAIAEGSERLECGWQRGRLSHLDTRSSLHLRSCDTQEPGWPCQQGCGAGMGTEELPSSSRVLAEDEEDEEEKIFPADSPVLLRELHNDSHYSVWVQASNALGTARSAPRRLSLQEIVVPALPVPIGANTTDTSPAITSTRWRSRSWLRNLRCEERHRATGTPSWHVRPPNSPYPPPGKEMPVPFPLGILGSPKIPVVAPPQRGCVVAPPAGWHWRGQGGSCPSGGGGDLLGTHPRPARSQVEPCDKVAPEGPRWWHRLQSDTEFVFQARCRLGSAHSPWSAWSPPFLYRTPEAAPAAAPAVWRRLGPVLPNGSREVTVLIKPLAARDARGRILSYAVSTESAAGARPLCHTAGTECSGLVPPGARGLLVTAHNSRGVSSPARIPLSWDEPQEEFPAPEAVEVKAEQQGRFLVRWQPPRPSRSPPLCFILEWVSSSQRGQREQQCWERVPERETHTYIQGRAARNPFGRGTAHGDLIDPNRDLIDPNRDLINPNRDLINPNQHLISPNRDLINPNQHLISPNQHLISPNRDLIKPNRDPINPNWDLINPNQHLIDPNRDLISRNQDLIHPNWDSIDPNWDPIDPNWDPINPNRDPINPNQHLIRPNRDFIDPNRATKASPAAVTSSEEPPVLEANFGGIFPAGPAAGAAPRVSLFAVYPGGISAPSSSPAPAEEPLLGSSSSEMSQDDDIRIFLGLSLSMVGLAVLFAVVMFKKSVRKRTKATLVSLLPKWLFEDIPHVENSAVVKSLQVRAEFSPGFASPWIKAQLYGIIQVDKADFSREGLQDPFLAPADPAVTEVEEVPAQEWPQIIGDTEARAEVPCPREVPRSVVAPSTPSPGQLGAYKPQLSDGNNLGYVAAGIYRAQPPAAIPQPEVGIFSRDYSSSIPQLWEQQGGTPQLCLLEKINLVLNSSLGFPGNLGQGSVPEQRWEPPGDGPQQMLVPKELLSCLRATNTEPVDANPPTAWQGCPESSWNWG